MIAERAHLDLILLGYWLGIKNALPNYTDQSIVSRFRKECPQYCDGCTDEAIIKRIARMRELWIDDQRTKDETA